MLRGLPRRPPASTNLMEDADMRRLVSAAVLGGVLTVFALPALAQAPAPKGPADCKANETWDQATRTCKPKEG